MTDTPAPHYATCEQLDAALSALQRLCSHVAELRDRVEHLERMHETAKACIADIYERLDKLKDGHESNWARIVKLEEAADDAEDMTLHTIAMRMVDTLQHLGVLPEILNTLRRAIREPMVPAAEPAPPARKLVRYGVTWEGEAGTPLLTPMSDGYWTPWHIAAAGSPGEAPAPAPAGSLVEVVAAIVANGIACDRDEERIAADVIAAAADWLQHNHTGRIANGSQFADLLRETLEREAGR